MEYQLARTHMSLNYIPMPRHTVTPKFTPARLRTTCGRWMAELSGALLLAQSFILYFITGHRHTRIYYLNAVFNCSCMHRYTCSLHRPRLVRKTQSLNNWISWAASTTRHCCASYSVVRILKEIKIKSNTFQLHGTPTFFLFTAIVKRRGRAIKEYPWCACIYIGGLSSTASRLKLWAPYWKLKSLNLNGQRS